MTSENNNIHVRRVKPSLPMRLGSWLVTKQPKVFPEDGPGVRAAMESRDPPQDAPLPESIAKKLRVERSTANGHDCVTLHPKTGPGAQHIIYFHGGGFVIPMMEPHWPLVAKLVETTGASLTVPLYPVVPEASHTEADALADTIFERLSAEWKPEDIILCGDSAGGHMALSLALRLAAKDGPQAGKLVLFAPWLDLTLADPAIRDVEPNDIMLRIDALRAMGEMWAGDRDPASAECSPLRADVKGLPPTAIFQGQHDLFVIDARTFAARLREAGIPVELYEYGGAPHVYMALTFTGEAKDTFRLFDRFIKR